MNNKLSDTPVNLAFIKLISQVYFDKQNLHLRERLARFIEAGMVDSLEELNLNIQTYGQKIKSLLGDINIILLPKTVKENNTTIDESFLKSSFYTNQIYKEPALVEKIIAFIDAPIEIHIISVMWMIKYGYLLDKELDKCCVGNRLLLNRNDEPLLGRSLFKPYEKQYQKWWSDGIKDAKSLFEKNENVTILNFDIKNYYHSIRFDFKLLKEFLISKVPDIDNDPLHQIFIDIHLMYAEKLKTSVVCIGNLEPQKFPLPIGLYSSCVLANWYLHDFDKQIRDQINPVYYGRYVDDLMLVVKDTLIERFEKTNKELDNEDGLISFYINRYFGKLFTEIPNEEKAKYHIKDNEGTAFKFAHNRYEHLCLQSEKIFIYQFNADFSPHLLNKFQDEQRERLSAFQFLSEEDDDNFKNLDDISFESNFDEKDVNKAKFKKVDDNKYKIAVYLVKLIQGSVLSGSNYRIEESNKVKKFFKGYYLIKNYYFWEKLFTLGIVRKDYKYLFDLYGEIKSQVDILALKLKEENSIVLGPSECINKVKNALYDYLNYSFKMAVGLYPGVIKEDAFKISRNNKLISEIENLSIYRNTWLLRKAGVVYPLLQFAKITQKNDFALYDRDSIRRLTSSYTNMESRKDLFEIEQNAVFPYRIKFYECCLIEFKNIIHNYNETSERNNKREIKNYIDSEKYLDTAFETFYNVNYLAFHNVPIKTVKSEYFNFCEQSKKDIYNKKIKSSSESTPALNFILIPNSSDKDKLRTCIINKFVNHLDYVSALEGKPIETPERLEDFNQILDSIKRVEGADFFIMPELALPFGFAAHFAQYSVQNQIGFTTGIEHLKIGDIGFNFLMTSLPMKVDGIKDAVLLFRLKNHYSHAEEKLINDKLMVVPKPEKYYYDLVQWRGAYFTSYYCFEIADIQHRSKVYGLADVLFVPVWNPDMHYYNSLTESASRDMHCFVVMCNTSQYGDSRVIAPLNHIYKDLLRVKGGTVKEHKSTTLVSDLDLSNLRDFQNHAYPYTESFNTEHKTHFKPLPPEYPYALAQLRKAKKLFVKINHHTLVGSFEIDELFDPIATMKTSEKL